MDVNAVNSMGLTAVHGAANRGSDDIIRFLVEKGARLDVKDKEGRTPLTWAEGVFLATHPAKPKPSSIALIKSLMGSAVRWPNDERPVERDHGLVAIRLRRSRSARGGSRIVARSSACCALATLGDARAASRARRAAGAACGLVAHRRCSSRYCVTCHNERAEDRRPRARRAELSSTSAADAATWEKVVRKIKTGMMPPSGARRPERERARRLRRRARSAARSRPRLAGAGLDAPALHRLNRTEYANAIRDLLALDVDVTALLPADASSEGFDNIADALGVSPSLIQGYVSAAMKISRRAVGDRTLTPSQITYAAPGGLAQDRTSRACRSARAAACWSRHTFPLDAEYEFSVARRRSVAAGRWAAARRRRHARRREVAVPEPAQLPHQGHGRTARRSASPLVDRQRGGRRGRRVFRTSESTRRSRPPAACRRSSSPGRSTPPARATRRAGDGSSCAGRPIAASDEATVRAEDRHDAGAPAFRRPLLDDEVETLMGFYQQGRASGDFEIGHPAGAGADPRRSALSVSASKRSPSGVRRGTTVSHQRSRARLAVVVLPVEQHSGRRTAGRGEQGPAARSRACSSSR